VCPAIMAGMPSMKARLQNDLTAAMRAREELTVSTLRLVLAAVMNAEVAGPQAVTLTDDQVLDVLRVEAKKRTEAAEIYESAGRNESAATERAELRIIEGYLPAAMADDELDAIVGEEVARAASNGTEGPKAMGTVIKAVRERVGSAADGSRIASSVKRTLG
jgi:uncharacterized protein